MALVLPELLATRRLVDHDVYRLEYGFRLVGRQCRRKTISGASNAQDVGEIRVRRDEAADATVSLAQRSHLNDARAVDAEMLRGAGAGAPEHAGAVRVIDVHSRIVAVGQCDKVRQRDDVTVLTEHAVAGDDLDERDAQG